MLGIICDEDIVIKMLNIIYECIKYVFEVWKMVATRPVDRSYPHPLLNDMYLRGR